MPKVKKKQTKAKTSTPVKRPVAAKAKRTMAVKAMPKKGAEIARGRPARGAPAVVTTAATKPVHTAALGGGVETRAAAASRGKYVYCVIRSNQAQAFGAIGLGEEPADVNTVNYKDLAAVVSDTPVGIHDPTRENVLAHQRV